MELIQRALSVYISPLYYHIHIDIIITPFLSLSTKTVTAMSFIQSVATPCNFPLVFFPGCCPKTVHFSLPQCISLGLSMDHSSIPLKSPSSLSCSAKMLHSVALSSSLKIHFSPFVAHRLIVRPI